jgi:hypothetical protein
MATYTKFNCFVEDLAEKKHNLGSDNLTVALSPAANAPVNTNTVLANLTQATYTYCSSRVITRVGGSSQQTGGTYKLVVDDLTLTASGGTVGPFRYISVYNGTNSGDGYPVIAFYDYGSDITLQAGETFTIDFDGTNGFLQLA